MKKALVLSGGGAKGSYQVGVWKALRKLKMKFDIVTGASIGSINGALYASNKYFLAKKLWKTITTEDLFDYSIGGNLSKDDYKGLLKEVVTNGGMSFDKAACFLNKYIDERKVKKSKIDFGLITVSLNNRKPKTLTKEQIPEGKLVDYLCASSICYPFVAKKEIDGDYYIDGGFYDGIPINLAIDMGATEVLAIDLNVFALVKKPKNKDVKIDYIRFKDEQPLTLTFNKKQAIRNMKIGYNDTMKHFNKLDGNIYTFKKNNLEENYKFLENNFMIILKEIILPQNKSTNILEIIDIGRFNKLFSNIKSQKKINKEINESLEYLGEIFNIPNDPIYNINTYNKLLVKKVKELSYIKLNKNLKGKFLISYMYNKYKENSDLEQIRKEFYNIALLFPKDFLAGLYLICLTNKYSLFMKTDEIYNQIIQALNKK